MMRERRTNHPPGAPHTRVGQAANGTRSQCAEAAAGPATPTCNATPGACRMRLAKRRTACGPAVPRQWGRTLPRRAGLALFAVIVAACGASDLSDLEDMVGEAARSSAGDMPAPTMREAISSTYGAVSERSPFEPFAEVQGAGISAAPDPARRRQPQEFFPLGQLQMVGTLAGRQRLFALIRDPNGTTRPLGVGDYLGRDHGRITNVDEIRIEILELVEDGQGGWTGRPRALELTVPDATGDAQTATEADHGNGGER